jgi:hypothetical protein
MPVPSAITDLSTVAGSNSPAGSETPGQGDDYLRVLSAFLAQVRDQLNGVSNSGTIKNPVFSGGATGALSTLPTISATSVTWSGNPTHSGNHTWSGVQIFNSAVAFASVPTGLNVSAYKTAATSRSSTTTLTNDPHLVLSLGAGTWSIEAVIPVWSTTNTAGGFKGSLNFTGTATSAEIFNQIVGQGGTAAYSTVELPSTVAWSSQMIAIATQTGASKVTIAGSIVVTVAGTLSYQWCQDASSVNAANVGFGAYILCTKLS